MALVGGSLRITGLQNRMDGCMLPGSRNAILYEACINNVQKHGSYGVKGHCENPNAQPVSATSRGVSHVKAMWPKNPRVIVSILKAQAPTCALRKGKTDCFR